MLGDGSEERWLPADDRALREQVEQIVDQRFGGEPIRALVREPSRYVGSYDCHAVTVTLASGSKIQIFLKVFGFTRQSKDQPEERRDRELCVYRDLLAEAGLGTPRFYGSVWDAATQRYWLLIELVEGTPLDEPNREFAGVAAGWLARLHGYFHHHRDRLAALPGLPRMDADYFLAKAEQAQASVAEISPDSVPLFAAVVPRYCATIPVMTTGPDTLVHGGYIPWHLMIDRTSEPARVCVIDWELAMVGCGIYDLAFFVDDAPDDVIRQACEVYRAAALAQEAPAAGTEDLLHAVRCFRLHRVFDWLSRSVEREHPQEKVDWLVERAVQRSAALPSLPA